MPPRACARPADRSSSEADLLIGSRRRRRQVPRPPVGVEFAVGRLGQRQVRCLALRQRGRPVDSRAHQRMTEPHPRADLEQPVRLGGGCGRCRNAKPLGRLPDQHGVADRFGRGDQQQQRACRQAAPQAGAGSSPRPAPGTACAPPARTRPPTGRGSARGAVPAAPADCHSSRPRCGPVPAHQAEPGQPSATAHVRPRPAGPGPRAPAAREAPRPGRARRTSARQARPAGAGPRRPAPARTPDPATARHRPGTAAAAPPLPPTAGSAPPARPETDPAHPRRAVRTQSAARHAADPAAGPGDRAAARRVGEGRRTPAPSLIPPPRPGSPGYPMPRRPRTPAAPTCRPPPHPGRPAPTLPGSQILQEIVQDLTLPLASQQRRRRLGSHTHCHHRPHRNRSTTLADAATRGASPRTRSSSAHGQTDSAPVRHCHIRLT